jgi:hemerythrin
MLRELFPFVPSAEIDELASCPIVDVNAGSNVLRNGETIESLDLLLTGSVEHLMPSEGRRFDLPVGSLLGAVAFVDDAVAVGTWRAISHVRLLRLLARRIRTLLETHDVSGLFGRDLRGALALRRSWLTQDRLGLAARLRIVRASRVVALKAGEVWEEQAGGEFLHVRSGRLEGTLGAIAAEDAWLGPVPGARGLARPQRWVASVDVEAVAVARSAILDVPVLYLRLLERADRAERLGNDS